MRIHANLGVLKAKDLKSPTTCFRLSKSLTHISDALAFGEFYAHHLKAFNTQDIGHISAGVYTSANAATQLASLLDNGDLKNAVESYSRSAHRFNENVLRPQIKNKAKQSLTPEKLKKTTMRLREDFRNIEKKVENLCTIEKKGPKKAVIVTKQSMGVSRATLGVTTPKKPIYPRYFVASMGRSKV